MMERDFRGHALHTQPQLSVPFLGALVMPTEIPAFGDSDCATKLIAHS